MIGMTNKEKYISSFSGVEPSDEIKERILNMASTKKRCSFKALAVAFAVLITVAAAMLTANAATDGALGEKISEATKEITKKVGVMFNGEEIEVTVKQTEVTDENGNLNVYEIILPENVPSGKDGVDVLELDKVMAEFCKEDSYVVIEKESGSSASFVVDIENESGNYRAVVETD